MFTERLWRSNHVHAHQRIQSLNGRLTFHLERLEPRVVLSGTNWANAFGSASLNGFMIWKWGRISARTSSARSPTTPRSCLTP